VRYGDCTDDAEVILYTVDGGGHTWPGGPDIVRLGKTTQAIDATALMWEFFQRHPMP
jgi:polyhydroxybutyrate depolymerase